MPKQIERPSHHKTSLWMEIGKATLIILKWFFIIGLISGFVAGGAALGWVASLVKDDPVRNREEMMAKMQENALTGFVYFNDDTVVGQLRTNEDRRLATLDEIPQVVLDAVLAIEDSDFYEHHGIDIFALMRAVKQKLLNEPVQTGASTITQQLARRVFLTLDKEDSRKAKEIFLSLRIERLMSKDQILLAYLNKVPFGNGSTGYNLYGIKAAAKGIFDIDDLHELNVAQAAFLAGLPQQPSNFSSFNGKGEFDPQGFERAVKRQQLVLSRMLAEDKITKAQYDEALAFDLKSSLAKPGQKAYNTYPFLMIEAERQATEALMSKFHPDLDPKSKAYEEAYNEVHEQLLRDGYHIYTTIDKTIYDMMQEIAKNPDNFAPDDPKKGIQQVGAVMLDNKSGAILGMIEGRDFFTEQLNHATQALRQPGSTMKPIAAYAPAIELGKIQPASVIDDVPIVLKDGQKGVHLPNNWDFKFHGLITARTALNQSYNIPAIKLFVYDVGIEKAWDFAKKMGITSLTPEDYYAQTGVIGGLKYGVSVKEMTNAYATLANRGIFNEAFMIRKIVDANGKTVYEHEKRPAYVFSEQTTYLITDMLRTVVTSGTGTVIRSEFKHYGKIPVVGKTGTTQEDADAWFIGYTPDVTLGVWNGYELPKYTLSKEETKRPLKIWSMIMDAAIESRPELFPTKSFAKPDGIVEYTVSDVSGKRPTDLTTATGHLVTDLFNEAQIPEEADDALVKMFVVQYDGVDYIPQPTTPYDMLQEKVVVKREKSISRLLAEVDEALQQLPEQDRRPISYYIPQDAELDAPTDTDPRTDDGKAPSPPGNIALSRSGDEIRIHFSANAESDVVGYRLYRSTNHGPFQRVNGKVVLSGRETVFTDSIPQSGVNGYYVTAVDVAGKESAPSTIVYSDGSSINPSLFSQFPTNPNGGTPGKPQSGNQSIGGQPMPTPTPAPTTPAAPTPGPESAVKSPPAAPSGLTVKATSAAIDLTWKANPPSDRVTQYNIYYSAQEKGPYTKLGTASNATRFLYYSDKGEGYYKISAVNAAGESKLSDAVRYKK